MGCLRRLQHWNLSSIIVEYRAYAGNKARYVNEQFIELFDIDWITLPANLPTWWIEQEAMWVGSVFVVVVGITRWPRVVAHESVSNRFFVSSDLLTCTEFNRIVRKK